MIGLVGSFPLWILIATAIKLEDGGPVFYSQARVGKEEKCFTILKFRSMISDAEKMTGPILASKKDHRVTRIGRLLRATAMDELPQLWNIFRGDISFVGPRAERPEFVKKYRGEISKYDLRHSVRPGLTGVAQVYGRYDSHPKQKLHYDLLYVRTQTFLLDMKLVFLSFWITFRGKWESRSSKI